MVARAMDIGQRLQEKMDVEVINARFLKPIDAETINISANKTNKVVTIEDNIMNCGLATTVNNILKSKIAICYPKIFNNFRMAISNMKGEHGICLDQARKNHSFKKNY